MAKIRRSNPLEESLIHFCELEQIKYLAPVVDMPVRWNSTYTMLSRSFYLRNPLDKTVRSDSKFSSLALNSSDWKTIEEVLTFLKPFHEMTLQISEHCTPALSLTAAIYIEMYNHVKSYQV
ncbi:unnamed protein product [Allacma fusca]|uniref:Zinc finger BED domain-containing protein 4 n=2 Tax=Allacma fusca TaxID=39272 RepID=A0A8J2LJT3_9HEXA|nr:unnamed protein product [Allacma fusca]